MLRDCSLRVQDPSQSCTNNGVFYDPPLSPSWRIGVRPFMSTNRYVHDVSSIKPRCQNLQ